jgi:glycosyltransferase involved in cell wall biosynthesis
LSGTTVAQANNSNDSGNQAMPPESGTCPPFVATRFDGLGKLKVALDLRDLPAEQVGTRTHAVNLARELARLQQIELTLLVQKPAQAIGMHGRVVPSATWADDVDLIHKPAQVMDPAELRLLFESKAHLAITYQDLIAFRTPLVFASETTFDTYRATSRLLLPAVQKVIAYSQTAQHEIAAEFGIPRDEISVVSLAAEYDRGPIDRPPPRPARLPKRYFFSLASDYPHKNLPSLLAAYARLRRRWKHGTPPQLVLAGYSSGARSGLYPQLEQEHAPEGVIFLGPVPPRQLINLFKHAEALVFASLYEGFGLPPLEAMAMGTPVIAMPVSAMPEVCGNGALYAEALSAEALCCSMERVACDADLRNELCARGYERVRSFTWEKTAKATLEAYRSAVQGPCERSLHMRRLLSDAILDWSAKNTRQGASPLAPVGVREAFRALKKAVRNRVRREFRRLRPISVGRLS